MQLIYLPVLPTTRNEDKFNEQSLPPNGNACRLVIDFTTDYAHLPVFNCCNGISGGLLQLYLGQPETTARLDNVHRFMAGIYVGCGIISLWAGITIARQKTLVFLLASGVNKKLAKQ
ncbi:MAG TPA: hypothetical protein PLV21_14295 [Cyclobacteriaceae bacterium]|nr:hypothetical protein [Cyclobacteriaceae bacterium]HRJ83057.1 hypothetical protein [Cyclobacteriaceae bacterium]